MYPPNITRFSLYSVSLILAVASLSAAAAGDNFFTDLTSSTPAAATSGWKATGSMNIGRENHTATLLPNGQVLVAGGINQGLLLGSAELYNPSSRTWTVTSSLIRARFEHTATLLPNGKVLVAGGNDNAYLSSAELYEPATGAWTPTGNMKTSPQA